MMKYFKNPQTQEVAGFDESIAAQLPYMQAKIDAGWVDVTGSWPPVETQKQAQDRLSPSITFAINDGARSWGYDTIESAVSYISSTNPQYVKEAQLLSKWRDDVWAWAIPRLNTVAPNTTVSGFLTTMPRIPTKP